jgi:exodeoxyribonuclease VII small subunit
MAGSGAKKKTDFSQSMKRLEEIARQLGETADNDLETALELFEEAMELKKICREKLDNAELRVKVLAQENGKLEEKEFYSEDEDAGQ